MIITKKLLNKYKTENTRDITAFGNPIILVLIAVITLNDKALLTALLSLATVEIIGSLIKLFVYKERPVSETYQNFWEKIDASSFPSLHTARVTAIFLPIAYFSTNLLSASLAVLFIITVAISRVLLKKHYKIDVLGGLILGIITVTTFIKTTI